jgi:hypothetical protein
MTDAAEIFTSRDAFERFPVLVGVVKAEVTAFAEAILHGDDEHRAWLLEAAKAWNERKPLPPVRSSPPRSPN